MKILREYTLDFIRQNKRTSCAIMIALYLTSTFLASLCGFLETMWKDTITLTVYKSGDWHGELFGETFGRDLPLIRDYSTVESLLIKGEFITAKIEDPRREYLSFRCANAPYWEHMSDKNELTEGRIPRASDEIVISKQYFENNPQLKVGDRITLPIGNRVKDGTVLEATEPLRSGESFFQKGERTFTIVGILDVTTASTVPMYYAMGYMEEEEIKPEESVTVYLRFHSIHDTYRDLPKIAELIGWETDEYGNYNLKYNADYLSQHFVFPKGQLSFDSAMQMLAYPLMYLFLAALVVGLFILIIHNAFSLSANSRITQLGVLASIGASPRQIRRSVIWEGLLLMLLPLPAGLATGWFLDSRLIRYINSINNSARQEGMKVIFSYGLLSILPAVLLTFLTVWFSAGIPAKRIARLTPIEAIRQGGMGHIKKTRSRHLLSRFFGIEGEMASSALSARKRSYRTATISLTLSFLLLACFWHLNALRSAQTDAAVQKDEASKAHIEYYLDNGQAPEQEILYDLKKLPHVKDAVFYSSLKSALWMTADMESEELKRAGGMEAVTDAGKYYPIKRDGQYRIQSYIMGLDDASFRAYCSLLGIDSAPYLDTADPRAIVYNRTADKINGKPSHTEDIDFLKLQEGDTLTLSDKILDEEEGESTFRIKAGHITDKTPLPGVEFPGYTLIQFVPMSSMDALAENCREKRRLGSYHAIGLFYADSKKHIEGIRKNMEEFSDKYYGSGDYYISDILEEEKLDRDANKMYSAVIFFISGLMAVIGLSNVWATVSGTLKSRRRELSTLRSVGLSPRALSRILSLEALLFGLTPILVSLPVQVLFVAFFLNVSGLPVSIYLAHAPFLKILAYTVLLLAVMLGTYALGSRKLLKENIIDALKDETF